MESNIGGLVNSSHAQKGLAAFFSNCEQGGFWSYGRCANLKPETILIIDSIVIYSTTIYRPSTEYPSPADLLYRAFKQNRLHANNLLGECKTIFGISFLPLRFQLLTLANYIS